MRSSLLIVGPQVVWNDIGVVQVRGEHELDGHRAVAIFAMLLAGDRESADVGESARNEIGG